VYKRQPEDYVKNNPKVVEQINSGKNGRKVFFAKYLAKTNTDGYAIVGEVNKFANTGAARPLCSVIYIYVERTNTSILSKPLPVSVDSSSGGKTDTKETLQKGKFEKIAEGTNWQMFKITCDKKPVDVESIGIEI
jgi:hypothetical protein